MTKKGGLLMRLVKWADLPLNDKLTFAYLGDYLCVCLLKVKLNLLVSKALREHKSFGRNIINLNMDIDRHLNRLECYEYCM